MFSMIFFSYFLVFQQVVEKLVVASILALDKFCIIVLKFSVIVLLIIVKLWYREFYKNLEYFATNINRRGVSVIIIFLNLKG